MSKIYAPMNVRYEATDEDMVPNPCMDRRWPEVKKLQWRAGCVAANTGVRIDIAVADEGMPAVYGWRHEWEGTHKTGGGYTYHEMHIYLEAFEHGHDEGVGTCMEENNLY